MDQKDLHALIKDQQKQCDECSALVNETKGRMVILDQESPSAEGKGDGFYWSSRPLLLGVVLFFMRRLPSLNIPV